VPARSSPASLHPGRTRREVILRESARLFARHGFHGVSVDDLGAAVGISGPGIYRHFAGKEALLGAVLVSTRWRSSTSSSTSTSTSP
jgi:AcrR family transcriptional regulator